MAWRQDPEDKDGITFDKYGVPQWNSERPDLFQEYKRRIEVLAAKAALEDEPDKARAKLILQMLSALTGEARKSAQSISFEALSAEGGHQKLLQILESGPVKLQKKIWRESKKPSTHASGTFIAAEGKDPDSSGFQEIT